MNGAVPANGAAIEPAALNGAGVLVVTVVAVAGGCQVEADDGRLNGLRTMPVAAEVEAEAEAVFVFGGGRKAAAPDAVAAKENGAAVPKGTAAVVCGIVAAAGGHFGSPCPSSVISAVCRVIGKDK